MSEVQCLEMNSTFCFLMMSMCKKKKKKKADGLQHSMMMKRATSIMEITPEIGAFCSEGFLPEKPVEAANNYHLSESMDYCMQTRET